MSLDVARAAIRGEIERLRAELSKLEGALGALEPDAVPAPPPPVPPPVSSAEVPPKVESRRAQRAATTKGARVNGSREIVLRALGATTDWTRCAHLEAVTGLGSNQLRMVLYKLREEGLAEYNGEKAGKSRWRAPVAHRDVKPENVSQPEPARAPGQTPPSPFPSTRTIKIEAITSRDDRFKCAPLSCVLTAGACIDRQAAANSAERGTPTSGPSPADKFRICKSCPLGRQVAARIEASK